MKTARRTLDCGDGFMLALAILVAPQPAASQAEPVVDTCGDSEKPSVAKLDWVELPSADSEVVSEKLTLRVTNLGDVAGDLQVAVVADTGGPKHLVERFRVKNLRPRATTDSGKSTNLDWLCFWWDWYAPPSTNHVPSLNSIAEFYADTILGRGLSRSNYPDPTVRNVSGSWSSRAIRRFGRGCGGTRYRQHGSGLLPFHELTATIRKIIGESWRWESRRHDERRCTYCRRSSG